MSEEKIIQKHTICWLDPCTGTQQTYTYETVIEPFSQIDAPVFANDSVNGDPKKDTIVVKAGTLYARQITAGLRDGLPVGTIVTKADSGVRFYVSNYVKKGEGYIEYKFRKLDHSDPMEEDLQFFTKDSKLIVKGFIHSK